MKTVFDTNVLMTIAIRLTNEAKSIKYLNGKFEVTNWAIKRINSIVKNLKGNNELVGSSVVNSEFTNNTLKQEFNFLNRGVIDAVKKVFAKNSVQYYSKFEINMPVNVELQGDTRIYLSFADSTRNEEKSAIITFDNHFPYLKNKFIKRYNHVIILRPNNSLSSVEEFLLKENYNNSLASRLLRKFYDLIFG